MADRNLVLEEEQLAFNRIDTNYNNYVDNVNQKVNFDNRNARLSLTQAEQQSQLKLDTSSGNFGFNEKLLNLQEQQRVAEFDFKQSTLGQEVKSLKSKQKFDNLLTSLNIQKQERVQTLQEDRYNQQQKDLNELTSIKLEKLGFKKDYLEKTYNQDISQELGLYGYTEENAKILTEKKSGSFDPIAFKKGQDKAKSLEDIKTQRSKLSSDFELFYSQNKNLTREEALLKMQKDKTTEILIDPTKSETYQKTWIEKSNEIYHNFRISLAAKDEKDRLYNKSLEKDKIIINTLETSVNVPDAIKSIKNGTAHLNISDREINASIVSHFEKQINSASSMDDILQAVNQVKQLKQMDIVGTKGLKYGQILKDKFGDMESGLVKKINNLNKTDITIKNAPFEAWETTDNSDEKKIMSTYLKNTVNTGNEDEILKQVNKSKWHSHPSYIGYKNQKFEQYRNGTLQEREEAKNFFEKESLTRGQGYFLAFKYLKNKYGDDIAVEATMNPNFMNLNQKKIGTYKISEESQEALDDEDNLVEFQKRGLDTKELNEMAAFFENSGIPIKGSLFSSRFNDSVYEEVLDMVEDDPTLNKVRTFKDGRGTEHKIFLSPTLIHTNSMDRIENFFDEPTIQMDTTNVKRQVKDDGSIFQGQVFEVKIKGKVRTFYGVTELDDFIKEYNKKKEKDLKGLDSL